MAWQCSGTSNEGLIENMWKSKLITEPKVKEAFLKVNISYGVFFFCVSVCCIYCHLLHLYSLACFAKINLQVDRGDYSPAMPYEDSPQPIGHSATISAPHMHASAIEHVLGYLVPSSESPAPRVLDIGSGSGYLTHVMAELVGDRGLVVGLEHIRELKELGETNMARSAAGRNLLETGRVKFRVGDGRKGWKEPVREGGGSTTSEEDTGWDVIHVGAAAKEMHPELLTQLKAPGW